MNAIALFTSLYVNDPLFRRYVDSLVAQAENTPCPADLIEHFTGQPNLTHAWNEFGLKNEVVERVLAGAEARTDVRGDA